jgi:hypothetical protein
MNSAGTGVNAEGKWLISSGGGTDPRWRGDGGELYYQAADGKLMAVEIMTKPVFRAGTPRPFELRAPGVWDSSADGRRFLATAIPSGKPELYTVLVNWQAGLKK